LLLELDRAEFASDIPPADNAFRERLARRVTAYACARIGEAEEGDLPDDPYLPDDFALRAGAGLAALALFPQLDPNVTPALWNHVTGHAPSAARLARLARLPWFRAGRMPDWFRSDLARCFRRETERLGRQDLWEKLRADLTLFANLCLARTPGPISTELFRSQTPIERLRSQMRELLNGADPASRALVEERLFLTFLEHGEVAGTELAVRLPAADRLAPAMRLSLLGFGVAALVAAAFAPWALRTVYSWTAATINLSGGDGARSTLSMLAFCLPGALLGIFVAIRYMSGREGYYIKSTQEIFLISVIFIEIIYYVIQYVVVNTIVTPVDSPESTSISSIIFYFSIPAIVVIIVSIIFKSNSDRENLSFSFVRVYYSTGLSSALSLVFLLIPADLGRSFDPNFVLLASATISLAYIPFSKGYLEKIKNGICMLSVMWQLQMLVIFFDIARGWAFTIPNIYVGYVSVTLYILVCAYLFGIQISDGISRTLERVVFTFASSISALFVTFQYYSTFTIPALLFAGLVASAAVIGWFWLFRNRRLGLRLTAYVLRFLKPAQVGRFGSPWLSLLLKAVLAGSVFAFLANAVVALPFTLLGSSVVPDSLQIGFPGLVSQSSSEPLLQIAATVALFLASYVLCRLTMRIYPAAASVTVRSHAQTSATAGSLAKNRIPEIPARWWVTFALWAVAILPASLHNWLSTADLLNIGALSKLGAQGFAAIDSVQGALTWALQVLFWLGGSTWPTLAYLALPVALGLGLRNGPVADRPILIGLLPFLLAVTILPVSTPGGVWMVPLVFLLLRLARDPASARRLLRFGGGFGGRPASAFLVFTLVFCLALVLSLTVIGKIATNGVVAAIDPQLARAAVFVLIGAMQLPRWPVVAALGLHLLIAVLPFDRFNFGLADTGIGIIVGFTPGEAIDLALSFAAVPLTRLLRRIRTDSPLWALSMIVLGMVTAAAITLSFGDGGVSVGTFLQLPTGELYRPTDITVAILALTIGLAIQAQHSARFYLVVLGAILAAIAVLGPIYGDLAAANSWTGVVFVTQPEALTSPVADLIASLPALVVAAGFMLLGRAAAGMLLGQAVTDRSPGRAKVDELTYGTQPFFSTSSAVESEAVLGREKEAVLK